MMHLKMLTTLHGKEAVSDPISRLSEQDFDINVEKEQPSNNASFRRRQVVSNWDRYHEPEVEDIHIGPTSRGDNFLKLLDSAGAASAQFRFKDEESWEDDETDQSEATCLNVDLASLATNLSCIPLHERLGLDQSLFTEEELNKMTEDAVKARSFRCTSATTSTDRNVKGSVNTSNIVQKDSKKTVIAEKCNTKTSETSHENKSLETLTCDALIDAKEKKTSKNKVDTGGSGGIEDDLDFLLSLDTPSVPVSEVTTQQSTSKESQKSKGKEKQHSGDEDLEDWLDSILD
ncbi:hypothetical protein FSP39_009478 [Pinctada imbricata]|uniref:Cell death regulator Aven n=1 Tax=Pinctada imbricata TaxID=66713 RepID=A0AA88XTJ4_PINIB|nr:hypothetical protein FSP39_009478 [Pinctada imbricata]